MATIDTTERARGGKADAADAVGFTASVSASEFSESTASGFHETQARDPLSDTSLQGARITLPVLGTRTAAAHQRLLSMLLALFVALLLVLFGYSWWASQRAANQANAAAQGLAHSQRLAKSVSQAVLGQPGAAKEMSDSAAALGRVTRALKSGDGTMGVSSVGGAGAATVDALLPMVERAEQGASAVAGQAQLLAEATDQLRAMRAASERMADLAGVVVSAKIAQGAPAPEVAAASQLVMLAQRIGKSANEFMTVDGARPEAAPLLEKDLSTFKSLTEGLLNGSGALRLSAASDPATRQSLQDLLKSFQSIGSNAGAVVQGLSGLGIARKGQADVLAESNPMMQQFETLQHDLGAGAGMGWGVLLGMVLAALGAIATAIGLGYVLLLDSRQRQTVAELQRHEAEALQHESKRINDANQAAILRLMNELQSVAEGDLTQEATVTEDITGAIADSVNYTVEELRSLVGNVQNTATRVAQTTEQVETTSTELLSASTQQLREIRETGQSVLEMATRINDVSGQAQESATVARQSRDAAETGLKAVQATIGGMNAIRDQIQDTSKRIKRLGESSQEIGEITELISDITEQTNVLALNAAIQAASAGDAGRGFSVVAEEVQRLAERSGEATRQIAALVKAIQTDTQDAVAAMERSTHGVVEGAKLSDNAGAALSEIDQVSRRLAELIERISSSTSAEAQQANEVAGKIQHIFAVTEQTGEGTRSTADQVRDLSRMADELRQSVARFKIA